MNHTTNYNLNQWEDGDVVRREDFNADNAKIDAAIAAAASPVVKLIDYTLPSDAGFVNIDLSGVDLTQYDELWIYPSLVNIAVTGTVTLNNRSDECYYSSESSSKNYIAIIRCKAGGGCARLRMTWDSGGIYSPLVQLQRLSTFASPNLSQSRWKVRSYPPAEQRRRFRGSV